MVPSANGLMTPELAKAARRSLTLNHAMDVSPQGIAERAIRACEVLSNRLVKTLGQHGLCTLFKRCAQRLPTSRSPWSLDGNPWAGAPQDDPWLWLQVSLEQYDSMTAMTNFVSLLSEVIDLLQRIVGEVVVRALVEDAWPVAFPHVREARRQ
jgi:hypothetical protein